MTKQLFIVYDKDWSQSATLLYNLLSSNPDIKASLYTKKEVSKLVSREKCLYIGQDCSSMLNFNDQYNEFGVQVGYMGAKAWIKCSVFDWNIDKLKEFENQLKYYTEKYKTNKVYEEYIKKGKNSIKLDFQLGWEPWPGNAVERLRDENIISKGFFKRAGEIYTGVFNQVYFGGYYLKFLRKIFGDQPRIRMYQYLIGVFQFYEKYLNVFLDLSNSNKESNPESTINDIEKKK